MKQDALLASVKYDDKGLVPVVVQDAHSKKVRMLAYMNQEALRLTLETGRIHYYSRSRRGIWLKGETSGNYQYLKALSIDCDGDTLLAQIEQEGGISCHTGHPTCFFTKLTDGDEAHDYLSTQSSQKQGDFLSPLYTTISKRKVCPSAASYTNYLFEEGLDKILKKVGEEATEVIIAAKGSSQERLSSEIADLMYHLTVLLVEQGLSWDCVAQELEKRK